MAPAPAQHNTLSAEPAPSEDERRAAALDGCPSLAGRRQRRRGPAGRWLSRAPPERTAPLVASVGAFNSTTSCRHRSLRLPRSLSVCLVEPFTVQAPAAAASINSIDTSTSSVVVGWLAAAVGRHQSSYRHSERVSE